MFRTVRLDERCMSSTNPLFILSDAPLLDFLHPISILDPRSEVLHPPRPTDAPSYRPSAQTKPPTDILFDALIQASAGYTQCTTAAHQSLLSRTFFTYHKPRRKTPHTSTQHARDYHDSSVVKEQRRRTISRDEYKRLVDYYREPYTTDASPNAEREACLSLPAPPVEEPIEAASEADPSLFPLTEGEHIAIRELLDILRSEDVNQKIVYEAYSALPSPGVAYLNGNNRRLLLRRMSQVELKSQKSTMLYLTVIDDMKSANLSINEAEWNSAISFAGRCFVNVTAVEVEAALRMWKEMEEEAGIHSGHVTFNILFDIATKAGKYVLAEMILKEMASRNLRLNRFAHTGLIYYYGVRQDGQGVRKAYKELVEAGHVVDSVVMDCVIASFLRAGELPAAEQVYERRKRLFAEKLHVRVPTVLANWRKVRELGNVLDKAMLACSEDAEKLQQIQSEQYLGPGLRTYSIFVEYHVSTSGELRRIIRMLDEMKTFGIPMHGRIFVKLFKGFAYHGGVKYTAWTEARLEHVWIALKSALDAGTRDVLIQKWMVVWVLRAFTKCCGKQRSLEVWAEVKSRWQPPVEELDAVHHLLTETLSSVDSKGYTSDELYSR